MALSTSEVWTLVHTERQRLIADLAPLSLAEWETPSLCRGWSVHDVLAHLVDTATTGKRAFVWSMVRARGDFDRANDNGVRRFKRDDAQQTLAAFRQAEHLQKTPPAHRATRLVEAIVHGEDIRRPLGIPGEYPSGGVHEALAYQLRTPASFGGGREIAEGCRLVDAATGDAWGDGPDVTGEAVDLLLAASGRAIDPELLTGPGAHLLVERALRR
ncbi:maleylpyruvate isomerase family mycothiol-dependent enzyme [Paramicrobacterium fandaimingii]|uniref:maleylpyruvate isomerase family mycothiol-dependent enzyme n=1 Tax=Paramicrobacterium fandaimingii TaxID=2708079 RepID=UPI001421877A|nr:maleylpyruvate isomerase family mycothiol-dependent enzyme [Microbacterium fandaimingii]